MSSVVHTMGELDYIPPVRYPEDLDQAGEEAIAGLIRAIAGESAYDTLVVDIGSGRRTALSVMKLCRVIYMPIREDPDVYKRQLSAHTASPQQLPDIITQFSP